MGIDACLPVAYLFNLISSYLNTMGEHWDTQFWVNLYMGY